MVDAVTFRGESVLDAAQLQAETALRLGEKGLRGILELLLIELLSCGASRRDRWGGRGAGLYSI